MNFKRWHTPCLTLTFLFSLTFSAWSLPTAFFRKDQSIQVKNRTSSNLLSDSENEKLFYVLPPSTGEVIPTSFTGNANDSICSEMDDLNNQSAKAGKTMDDLSSQLSQSLDDYMSKVKIANDLVQVKDNILDNSKLLKEEFRLENEKIQLDYRLNDEYANLEKECSNTQGSIPCQEIQIRIEALRKQEIDLQPQIQSATMAAENDKLKYNEANEKAELAKNDMNNSLKYYASEEDKLIKLKELFFNLYKKYGLMQGGFISATYESGWDDNRFQLQKDNPNLTFENAETSDALYNLGFDVSNSNEQSYLSLIPPMISYSLNGVSYVPWNGGNQGRKGPSMSDKVTTTLQLSLAGACPIIKMKNMNSHLNSVANKPIFLLSTQYHYNSTYTRNIEIKYNLYEVYKLIQSKSSSQGIFDSSKWISLVDSKWPQTTFEINWKEQESDISPDEKYRTEILWKNEMLSRALNQMATPVGHAKSLRTDFPISDNEGIVPNTTSKCSSFSFYCAGDSWLLRGNQDIFGTTENEQIFSQENNFERTESLSNTLTTKLSASTNFTQKDNKYEK